jgi:hypothetical protein
VLLGLGEDAVNQMVRMAEEWLDKEGQGSGTPFLNKLFKSL